MPVAKTTIRGVRKGKSLKCKLKYRKNVEYALQSHAVRHAAQQIRMKMASGKATRVGSFHCAKAVEHQLQLLGSGFGRFEKLMHCLPLQKDEIAYYRPCKRPHDFEIPEGIPRQRACVKNQETGKKRYDVVWRSVREHPCLSVVRDEGPKDSPCWYFLQTLLRFFRRG